MSSAAAEAENGQTDDTPVSRPQIRNIRALFAALRASDPALRMGALEGIRTQPQVALSFGVFENSDVIDVLVAESQHYSGTLEWMHWLGALDCFPDARVSDCFYEILANEEEPLAIFAAARYLERSPKTTLIERIQHLLCNSKQPIRVRAAALVLKQVKEVSARAKLRMCLLCPGEAESPAFEHSASDLWLEELSGAFRAEAQGVLRSQGERTWIQLAMLWDKLQTDARIWLLQWGSVDFPYMTSGLAAKALSSGCDLLTLEALRVMGELGEDVVPESIRALARPFVADCDTCVREAALAAHPPDVNWRELLREEAVPNIRRVLIGQLVKAERDRSIPDLLHVLRTEDWQERAVATEWLVRLGRSGADAVKPLLHDVNPQVRTAAARVLLELQEDDWVDHELLSGAGMAESRSV